MKKIKICGITSPDDAKMVSRFSIFAIGLNFIPRSKRKINITTAKEILKVLKKSIKPILIFENEDLSNIIKICKTLKVNFIQLHGSESPEYCKQLKRKKIKIIKALHGKKSTLSKLMSYKNFCDYILIDAYDKKNKMGGTGKKANWKIAKEIKNKCKKLKLPIFLAGGLTPTNILEAIKIVNPDFIDINSGVESTPGKKDRKKIERLF